MICARSPQTNFCAGGLLGPVTGIPAVLAAPTNFVAPRFIDNRGYCTPTEDQGSTSTCAAQSMSTLIEALRWRRDHFQTMVNPYDIYAEAKRIDGNNEPGTYLTSVFEASKVLSLIPVHATCSVINNLTELKYALHSNTVALLGFRCTEGWNRAAVDTGFISESGNDLGGHAVLGCAYEDGAWVGFQNSWSPRWGHNGFGRMSEKYFNQTFMNGLAITI